MWCSTDRGRQRLKSDGDCMTYYNEEYHIVVVGAPAVGKNAICQTYVKGQEDGSWDRMTLQKGPTVERAEFCTWDKVDDGNCFIRLSKLQIPLEVKTEEIEDDPHVATLTQMADGFLLIYSVTDKGSFKATSGFYHMIIGTRNYTDTPLVFAGHKSDAQKSRHISISEGRDAAFDLGASFYETSSLSDPEGVKYLFHDVIRQIRAVRTQARIQEQTCTRVRGFINRLSLKSKRRRSRSRSRIRLMTSQQTL